MENYVFVIYAHSDLEKIEKFTDILKENNFDYLMDSESALDEEDISMETQEAIKDANGVVVLMSKDAQKSFKFKQELTQAIRLKKIILTIELERCDYVSPFDKMLQYYLSISLWYKDEDMVDNIVTALKFMQKDENIDYALTHLHSLNVQNNDEAYDVDIFEDDYIDETGENFKVRSIFVKIGNHVEENFSLFNFFNFFVVLPIYLISMIMSFFAKLNVEKYVVSSLEITGDAIYTKLSLFKNNWFFGIFLLIAFIILSLVFIAGPTKKAQRSRRFFVISELIMFVLTIASAFIFNDLVNNLSFSLTLPGVVKTGTEFIKSQSPTGFTKVCRVLLFIPPVIEFSSGVLCFIGSFKKAQYDITNQ